MLFVVIRFYSFLIKVMNPKTPANIRNNCKKTSSERNSHNACPKELISGSLIPSQIEGAGVMNKKSNNPIKAKLPITPNSSFLSIVYFLSVKLITETNNTVIKPAHTESSNTPAYGEFNLKHIMPMVALSTASEIAAIRISFARAAKIAEMRDITIKIILTGSAGIYYPFNPFLRIFQHKK